MPGKGSFFNRRQITEIIAGLIPAVVAGVMSFGFSQFNLFLQTLTTAIPSWLMIMVKATMILLIILAGLIVVKLVFQVTYNKPRLNRIMRDSAVALSVMSVLLAVCSGGFTVAVLLPGQPAITIASPTSGATVNQTQIVYGSAQHIPAGETLWLVLYDPVNRLYYPQDPSVTVQPNNEWSKTIYMGGANDTGRQFVIQAVLVNSGANASFSNYVNHGKSTGDWPGIKPEQYPAGANTYQTITVHR